MKQNSARQMGVSLESPIKEARVNKIAPQKEKITRRSGIAPVLSFFIPGLGQIFTGRIFAGLFWLLLVPMGYLLYIVPGLVLHIVCLFDARDCGT